MYIKSYSIYNYYKYKHYWGKRKKNESTRCEDLLLILWASNSNYWFVKLLRSPVKEMEGELIWCDPAGPGNSLQKYVNQILIKAGGRTGNSALGKWAPLPKFSSPIPTPLLDWWHIFHQPLLPVLPNFNVNLSL